MNVDMERSSTEAHKQAQSIMLNTHGSTSRSYKTNFAAFFPFFVLLEAALPGRLLSAFLRSLRL